VSPRVLEAIGDLPRGHVWEAMLPKKPSDMHKLMKKLIGAADNPEITSIILLPLMREISDQENKIRNPGYMQGVFTILYSCNGYVGYTHCMLVDTSLIEESLNSVVDIKLKIAEVLDDSLFLQKSHLERQQWNCFFEKLFYQFSGSPAQRVHACKTRCSSCLKSSVDLKSCMKCLMARYCNAECQKAHWSEHKLDCNMLHEVATVTRINRSPLQNLNNDLIALGKARVRVSTEVFVDVMGKMTSE
jgi:hypothetical protein